MFINERPYFDYDDYRFTLLDPYPEYWGDDWYYEDDLYVDEHLQVDFSGMVRLSRGWSLALQLINLTDEPYRVFQATEDRPVQEEYYSWWGTFGVKYDF